MEDMGIRRTNALAKVKEKERMGAREAVSREAMVRRGCRRPRRRAKEEVRTTREAMDQPKAEVKVRAHVGYAMGPICNGIARKVKGEARAMAMAMQAKAMTMEESGRFIVLR